MKKLSAIFLILTTTLAADLKQDDLEKLYPDHVRTGERALSKEAYYDLQKERIILDEERDDVPEQELKQSKEAGYTAIGKYGTYYTSHEGAFHSAINISSKGDAVELEDGSIWTVKGSDTYKNANWLTSDILLILPNGEWFSSYRYRILNINTGVAIRCNLTLKPLYNGIHTHWITAIDYTNRFVYLDDGSCWRMPSYENGVVAFWNLNDTVIIGTNNGFFSSDTYPNIIINTATEDFANGTCLN